MNNAQRLNIVRAVHTLIYVVMATGVLVIFYAGVTGAHGQWLQFALALLAVETAVSLLQPYAPHIAEELWQRLGHERLWTQPWPEADGTQLERDTVELVLQVNGKVRDRLQVPAGLNDQELTDHALASDRVRSHLNGSEPRKVIVVPDKLVNLVV